VIALLVGAWRYRYFIATSIAADLRMRFVRSKLGGLWMILNPLAQVAIFAFILSAVLSTKLPGIESRYSYALYLMSGMLSWSLFAEIVTRCLTVFNENSSLLTKLVFPKICLPLIAVGAALINNAFLLLATLFVFALLGHWPGIGLVWLPLLMLVTIALAIGAGLILGVLNVFMRDIGQVVPVLLQFLVWLTPIVYVTSFVPAPYRVWLAVNPLYAVVTGYQAVLVFGRAPEWPAVAAVALVAVVLMALALFMFRRASIELVDAL
jgi:lipopolysaccharide transport system permease protein